MISSQLKKIRNIGIMAHVDAGKTSLTERMLYLAGVTRRVGSVDDGDTVMDFMKQEQERGITIQSAAINFTWKQNNINLIDTPGHQDFSFEVEKSVRVLDGAVCLLDAVSGVQAQTKIVWNQSNKFNLPKILFVNKMDKDGSDFSKRLIDASVNLHGSDNQSLCFVPISYPIYDQNHKFQSVINVIQKNYYRLDKDTEVAMTLQEAARQNLISDYQIDQVNQQRQFVIDQLSGQDELLIEHILECDDLNLVKTQEIEQSLKRMCHLNKVVPVLCGSAVTGLGIDDLMQSIIKYLPSPLDKYTQILDYNQELIPIDASRQKDLIALAFKVLHDRNKGPLVYSRVYSGSIYSGQRLINSSQSKSIKVGKIYKPLADDLEQVEKIDAGNIAVLTDLTYAQTGDTLLNQETSKIVQFEAIRAPPSLFSAAIELESSSKEKQLFKALDQIQSEDPSISYQIEKENNQIILSGLGQLHLEIIQDRLKTDFGLKVSLGKLLINYKESLKNNSIISIKDYFNEDLMSKKKQRCQISIMMQKQHSKDGSNKLKFRPRSFLLFDDLKYPVKFDEIYKYINQGVEMALSSGPLMGYPVSNTLIEITSLQIDQNVSLSEIRQTVFLGMKKMLQENSGININQAMPTSEQIVDSSSFALLEPVARVEIDVPKAYFGQVVSDLTSHRSALIQDASQIRLASVDTDFLKSATQLAKFYNCDINSFFDQQNSAYQKVYAQVPISSLIDYQSVIRSLSQGNASYQMNFDGYQEVQPGKSIKLMKEYRGI